MFGMKRLAGQNSRLAIGGSFKVKGEQGKAGQVKWFGLVIVVA